MPLWKKKKAAEPAAPLDVLRWKIVAVNILFAAMVVATLCFVAARQGKNALEEKHRLAFASLCSVLEQPILETQTIDHKAIYSSALDNRFGPQAVLPIHALPRLFQHWFAESEQRCGIIALQVGILDGGSLLE